jgi:hypothetical protein
LKFANDSVLTQKIMPLADAKSAYDSALRQQRSTVDNWMPDIIKTPDFVVSAPGDDELGYPGFIGTLLSLAIVGRN